MLCLPSICYTIPSKGGKRTPRGARPHDQGRWLKMELYECYGETTAASGRKYWIFLGWAPLPDGKPTKVTAKFRYYDTPNGREKFRS